MTELQTASAAVLTRPRAEVWRDVCAFSDLMPERGVCVLLGGEQIAVFRTWSGELHAVSNYDPVGRAYVLSRGIVGSRGEVPTVASPLYKQAFDLRTGRCLDQPEVMLPVFPVRRRGDRVEIREVPAPERAP
ncbi:nitrite reductase small subunit NirD [Natronosporangium hydrolyticum]|uniref:Nitrite reductase small subunit NirD n=1 Tax=Natronosporangium hydrolyticum TaxID=2811111 RepID=A0A895YJA8_9ACTN|nr:nitrite reductase small subunit NirD [Natronosporangium hydrolyticum]QSB16122.1 nitrite reductase small subunit NirD [Natronosporangium hydrolyticum]